jgi:serine/threonine protein phosphatase PrpC
VDLIRSLGGRGERDAPREGHLVAYTTDIGRTHEVNQDAGGAWTWSTPEGVPVSLLVVADGVSAGLKSEEASRLAVRLIEERVEPLVTSGKIDVEPLLAALVAAAREANGAISERPHESLARADATTVVALVCANDHGAGMWCGDSRAYKVSGGKARPLTRDHSWREEVTTSGVMTREQAERDPRSRMITRWLGPPEQDDPGIETFRFRLEPGESVVLCSDGLFADFPDQAAREGEVAQAVTQRTNSPQAAADQLVASALRSGGRDNITVAILSRPGAA